VSAFEVSLVGLLPGGSKWVPVPHGASGAAVLHDAATTRYVKVVPSADADALAAERDRVEWLSGSGTGVPGSTVLDWRASEHGAALVTSAVAGVPAGQLDPTQLHAAWPSIIDTVRRLHRIPTASCPYDRTLNDMITEARATVAQNRVHTEFLPQHLQHTPPAEILDGLERELPRRREQEGACSVVCHGDLCLPNILIDAGTLHVSGLIDLGRLGCADPTPTSPCSWRTPAEPGSTRTPPGRPTTTSPTDTASSSTPNVRTSTSGSIR
jgi:streptomycin 3"-kinase